MKYLNNKLKVTMLVFLSFAFFTCLFLFSYAANSLPDPAAGPVAGSCVYPNCFTVLGEGILVAPKNLYVGSNGVPPNGLALGTSNGSVMTEGGILVNSSAISSLSNSAEVSAYFVGGYDSGKSEYVGRIGMGTGGSDPAYLLTVNGDAWFKGGEVKAANFVTGDIVLEKNGQNLWRIFEEEDGIFVESLKTGKTYRFNLEEVK